MVAWTDLTVGDATRVRGGKVLAGPKSMGSMGRYGVIQDPAGAVAALYEPAG